MTDTSTPHPSSGVSVTTLVIGIVVSMITLLLAFVFFVWLAFRKGWIGRKRQDSNLQDHGEKPSASLQGRQKEEPRSFNGIAGPVEMHSDSRPHQAGSTEVHQLHGDGTWRL